MKMPAWFYKDNSIELLTNMTDAELEQAETDLNKVREQERGKFDLVAEIDSMLTLILRIQLGRKK